MKYYYRINFDFFKKQIAAVVFGCFLFTSSFGHNPTCVNPGGACSKGAHKGGDTPKMLFDGSGTLGQTYSNSACGLNYVQGSVLIEKRSVSAMFNTNGTGLPSNITISGLPSCYIVEKAYLWITASYTSTAPPNANVSITNPSSGVNNYTFSMIGSSGAKCWAETGTATYRADVTTNISGNGVYNFDITGFINGSNEIDGATLLIIYRNPAVAYQGSLVIWDGIMTSGLFNNYPAQRGIDITGINACANSTYANAFLITSDMQANINGGFHQSTLNGVATSFPNDFWNFDVANTNVTAGQNTATFFADGQNLDCFSVSVEGLYYQTTTCTTCTAGQVLVANTSSSPSTCGSCNGSVSVTASGGTAPYTYSWDNGHTDATVTGLCSGTYSVTVYDNTGCNSAISSVAVAPSTNITIGIQNYTDVTCNGLCNGTATTSVNGGSSPYTYAWNNGGTSSTETGLCTGSYAVVVTDASGCSSNMASVSISEPSAIVLSTSATPDICSAGNGTASVVASGGAGGYLYSWSPSGGNGSTAIGLPAGNYSVTVTDASGCTFTQSVVVPIDNSNCCNLVLTTSSTPDVCSAHNGTATVVASGGTSGYVYLWSPSGGNGSTATGLPSGNYSVTVTDASGCTSSQSVVVAVDNSNCCSLVLATSSTPDVCGRNNGMAVVSVSGGIAPYSYTWSPVGGNGATASNLPAGNYIVNVTDANGCAASEGVVVGADNTNCCCNLTLAISSKTDATCEGGDDGSATVVASNGQAPYSYQWSPIGGTDATATGLGPGIYTVVVTPYIGCTASISVTISFDHPAPNVDLGPDTNICNGHTLVLDAGAGFTYLWSTNEITQTITVNSAGIYGVVLTDAFGCQNSDVISVNYVQCRRANNTSDNDKYLSIYPNPTKDVLNISINDVKNEIVSIEFHDILGNRIFSRSERSIENAYLNRIDLGPLSKGVYLLKVQYRDQVKTIKVIKD